MTLVEHLTELRYRLIVSLLAIAVGGAIAFGFYGSILRVLVHPYCDILPPGRPCTLFVRDPLEGFATRLKVAGWGGLAMASPVVLWQAWRFITPGLHPNEKKYAVPFVAISTILFASGGLVAMLTFPQALQFLIAVGGAHVEPLFSPGRYLSFVILMIIAFGISFEFPVLLVFLQLAGVLTPAKLSSWRRFAIVAILAAAAVITPSQDPYSLFAMAVPMYVFYELSIVTGRVLRR